MHFKQLEINLSNFNFGDAYRNPLQERDQKTRPALGCRR